MIFYKLHPLTNWFAVLLIICCPGYTTEFRRICGLEDVKNRPNSTSPAPTLASLVNFSYPTVITKQGQAIDVSNALFNSKGKCKEQYIIPIAWHVLFDSQGTGNVSESMLADQVRVLNKAFAGSPFRFATRSVDRTKNDGWFNYCRRKSRFIRSALGISPASTLNIYTCKFENPNVLGDATLPWMYREADKRHGVAVLFQTLPGGGQQTLNLGDNAVHEIGHYFGLYHVCEGGCYSNKDDDVPDTPRCQDYTYICTDQSVDSCPSQSGLDPIHNYMGYMEDACMSEFTPGQITKMENDVRGSKPTLLKNVFRPCKIDAIFRWSNHYIYLFLGSSYYRYSESHYAIHPGYPRPISDHWKNVPSTIDGVFRYADGVTYFFKGNQYYRFNDTSLSVDPGYPRLISDFWKGVPSDIDDVINYSNGYTYFFKGTQYYRFNPRTQRVDPGYPRSLASHWKGVPSDIEGALPWYNGGIYFFKNGQYWLFMHSDESVEVSADYPKSVTQWWSDEPDLTGYTVFRHCNGHTYFFRGSYYWRYNDRLQQVDLGYPRPLTAWGKVPVDVDAAFLWSDGFTYFFKGSQYFRYDSSKEMVEDGYPREISSFWKGVPSNVDAVFRYVNDITYFFKGSNYFRFNDTTQTVDPGYPRPITSFWKGVPSNLDTVFTGRVGCTFFFKEDYFYRFNSTSGQVDAGFPKSMALWRGILHQP